jgi:hypothetical protein
MAKRAEIAGRIEHLQDQLRQLVERGLEAANVRLLKTMTKRAGACLRNLQRQGGVT